MARPVLKGLFARLYESLEIDEDGLGRVKRAAATAPVIICPSHKSYVDFLVISWLLYEHGMMAPHIAAGINLSFWPFGAVFRRGGAFFIRRQVKGDRVYAAVLRAFVKQLLRDRFPQEFYIEGGRSRTGKLLFPKMGLVSMEVDAWLDGAADDVLFVPVSIDYEKLIEAVGLPATSSPAARSARRTCAACWAPSPSSSAATSGSTSSSRSRSRCAPWRRPGSATAGPPTWPPTPRPAASWCRPWPPASPSASAGPSPSRRSGWSARRCSPTSGAACRPASWPAGSSCSASWRPRAAPASAAGLAGASSDPRLPGPVRGRACGGWSPAAR